MNPSAPSNDDMSVALGYEVRGLNRDPLFDDDGAVDSSPSEMCGFNGASGDELASGGARPTTRPRRRA